MKIKVLSILFVCSLFFALPLRAQEQTSIVRFEQEYKSNMKTGMLVLGGWAALNMLGGTALSLNNSGENKYFHQGNALWNVVNLGIAVAGYLNTGLSDSLATSPTEMIAEYQSLQRFLLFNAGLDIAYIATGMYLREKSLSSEKKDMLAGYGSALLLQGGFLLLFDTVLYFVNMHNETITLQPYLNEKLGTGISLLIKM